MAACLYPAVCLPPHCAFATLPLTPNRLPHSCLLSAVTVRPTDVETFRAQLEAAGCDVEGALAAAAAVETQAESAKQAANGWLRSPASSPAKSGTSGSSGSSAEGKSEEGGSGRRLAGGRSMSAHSGYSSTASVPATNWAALGASYMSSGGSAAFEVAPTSALSRARSGGSSGNGAAAATVEDEEAESAALGGQAASVPDFAVYVSDTQELHRVSWDHGVTVRIKGECRCRQRWDGPTGMWGACGPGIGPPRPPAGPVKPVKRGLLPHLSVPPLAPRAAHPMPPHPATLQAGTPLCSPSPPSAATSLAAPRLLAWSLRPSALQTCSTAAARCRRYMPSGWRRLATPAPASWVRCAALCCPVLCGA